ncbi:MAG: VOC family protein [Bacteroidetes bacterium]|nr:VOC family protein [Bacteroidota bacterium]
MSKIVMFEIILYVSDQNKSSDFYSHLLNLKPSLYVPGITEFEISENLKLGLMPEKGIANILKNKTPHPQTGNGIPRCELYLKFDNADEYYQRAIVAGAKPVSKMQKRDWGDTVGYVADPDGHIIAFAT